MQPNCKSYLFYMKFTGKKNEFKSLGRNDYQILEQ